LVLNHGLEPQVELVFDLKDREGLLEDCDKLQSIDLEPHGFALLGDLVDKVKNQAD